MASKQKPVELEEMILAAFKKVPNELNKNSRIKRSENYPLRSPSPGGYGKPDHWERDRWAEVGTGNKIGRDSTFFDPNRVGKYILIKKKMFGRLSKRWVISATFIWNCRVEWVQRLLRFRLSGYRKLTFNISYEEEWCSVPGLITGYIS